MSQHVEALASPAPLFLQLDKGFNACQWHFLSTGIKKNRYYSPWSSPLIPCSSLPRGFLAKTAKAHWYELAGKLGDL